MTARSTSVDPTTPSDAPVSSSRRDIAILFLRQAAAGKVRDAYAAYVAPDFKHHNPFFAGDATSLLTAMEENAKQNPNKALDVKRVLADGDLVAILSHVRLKPDDVGVALVHIFRFRGDRIVELWDISQAIPADSPNANGMF